MRQAAHRLWLRSNGKGLRNVTAEIARWLSDEGIATGLLTVWCPHTSASLIVQENASPDVHGDIAAFMDALAPQQAGRYRHDDEGPDDMPAHLRTMLTNTQISVPVLDGTLALGIWQAIYLFEHRDGPQTRQLVLHLLGE